MLSSDLPHGSSEKSGTGRELMQELKHQFFEMSENHLEILLKTPNLWDSCRRLRGRQEGMLRKSLIFQSDGPSQTLLQ